MDNGKLKIKAALVVAAFVAICLGACGIRACSDARASQQTPEAPAAEQQAPEEEGLGEGVEEPSSEEVEFSPEQQRMNAEAGEDEVAAMAVLTDGIWTSRASTLQFFGNNTYAETFKGEAGEPKPISIHVLDMNQEGMGASQKVSYVLQVVTPEGEHVASLGKKAAPQGGEQYWELECDGAFVHGTSFQLAATATSFTVADADALAPYLADYDRLAGCIEELGAWVHAKYPTATMAVWDERADFDLSRNALTLGFVLDNSTTDTIDMKVDLEDWSWSVTKRVKGQGVV